MKRKTWWAALMAAITASFLLVPLVHAQATDADIAVLGHTFQNVVGDLQSAVTSGNVAQERTIAQANIGTAQSILTTLTNIQNTTTSDATRSRASGLAAHVQAIITNLQAAVSGPDAEVTGKINAALAEANEALAEIPATSLPATGLGAEVPVGMLVIVGGLGLLGAGLGLRRLATRA